MTRKSFFFEGWSWFKFNSFGLALGTNLTFHTGVAKVLKVKVRKFLGLVLMFVEVTREKLVGGLFWPPLPLPLPILNRVKNVTYFDRFGVEHIPKEIRKFSRNKSIITNIYRIQTYDSIMCRYFCIWFIDFMLKVKSLLKYTNLFSPNGYDKNDKMILKYFQ